MTPTPSPALPPAASEPVAWRYRLFKETTVWTYTQAKKEAECRINPNYEVQALYAAPPQEPAEDVAELSYGQKLIAEAIQEHFGERVEAYDEEAWNAEDDTSNHDAWEAFDALTSQSAELLSLRRKVEEMRKALEAGIEQYFERQIVWSRETFGPALRTGGVIDHIRKELTEIEADPHDLSEWIDVVILAMDGFWRHGGAASDLMPRLLAKQQKNMARSWPDWRTMSENQAIEHNRSEDRALGEQQWVS